MTNLSLVVSDELARCGSTVYAALRVHPRHVILFSLVAGLALATVSNALVIVCAVAIVACCSCRVMVAIPAALALLLGVAIADYRIDALQSGQLATITGDRVISRAILLEPLTVRASDEAVARVKLAGPAQVTGRVRAGQPARSGMTTDLSGEIAMARLRPSEDRASSPTGTGSDLEITSAIPGQGSADVRTSGVMPPSFSSGEKRGAPNGGRATEVGDVIVIDGVISQLQEFESYQRRSGAMVAIAITRWYPTGTSRGGVLGLLDGMRGRAVTAIERSLPAPQAALLRGLVLGQDESISSELREDFQKSGLAHLLAVSGQNVMLLCILVVALCGAVGVPLRARLAIAAVLVTLYVPLTGAGPSIQRAGVMGIVGLIALWSGRPSSRWYALGLAAVGTLAYNPLAIGDPGWQLSFAAVVGLLVFTAPLRAGLIRVGVYTAFADAIAITVAATLATAPLMAFHFEQVSLSSLPTNLLAVPAVAPIMWVGMTMILVAQVAPVICIPMGVLVAPLLGYLEWLAGACASIPGAAVAVALGRTELLALSYVLPLLALGMAMLWWRICGERIFGHILAPGAIRRPPKVLVVVAVLIAGMLLIEVIRVKPPVRGRGELVVSFLDVGQGDAVLVQRDGYSALVDTGPPDGQVERRLGESGVRRLDLLVLTHPDSDHDGNALTVIDRYKPRMVLENAELEPAEEATLNAVLDRAGTRRQRARAGQRLRLGPVIIDVLWPAPTTSPGADTNDRSVVTIFRAGEFDMLLTGDAESQITARLDLPRVDALKIAHHGSADSGLTTLLARTKPRIAAISVGRGNSFGHPAPATLSALRSTAQLIRTDRDGTARIRVNGGRMLVE